MTFQKHRVFFIIKPDTPCEIKKLHKLIETLPFEDGGITISYGDGWPETVDEANGQITCETNMREYWFRVDRVRRKFRSVCGAQTSAAIFIVPDGYPAKEALETCSALLAEAKGRHSGEVFAVSVYKYGGKRATFCNSFVNKYVDGGGPPIASAWPDDAFKDTMALIEEGYIDAREIQAAAARVHKIASAAAVKALREEERALYASAMDRARSEAKRAKMTLDAFMDENDLDFTGRITEANTIGMTVSEELKLYTICGLLGEVIEDDKEAELLSFNLPDSLEGKVGVFFIVKGEICLHTCSLEDAYTYGESYFSFNTHIRELWHRCAYETKFNKPFDYYPWGRFSYNSKDGMYTLEHDACITCEAGEISRLFPEGKCVLKISEWPLCHQCDPEYIDYDIRS